MEWAIGIGAVILGAVATYFITLRVSHRPKLNVSVTVATRLSARGIGPQFRMQMGQHQIENLVVYDVKLSLKGRKDIGTGKVQENPSIDFPSSEIYRVRTMNNDESKFRIPISISEANHRAYINLERMRAGTVAHFQLIGTDQTPDDINSTVQFFPGSILDTDITTSGIISRPWKKSRTDVI